MLGDECRVCSEILEQRISITLGSREDFPERVPLLLNLKELVGISKAGESRGRDASCQAREVSNGTELER